MQPRIRQIAGLEAALNARPSTAVNVGVDGIGIFKGKNVGGNLELYKLKAGSGIVELAPNANVIEIRVNVGTGANQIVQLDALGRLPALDGRNLTHINPDAIDGSISMVLALPHTQFFIGGPDGKATAIAKTGIPISGFGAAAADISLGAY
jgi:hypothetical protein